MSSKSKPREAELNFEGAMDRLEKIVEQMESGKLPLEDLIVRYEEGMNLVKICQERLANAEQKIEIIARNLRSTQCCTAWLSRAFHLRVLSG